MQRWQLKGKYVDFDSPYLPGVYLLFELKLKVF